MLGLGQDIDQGLCRTEVRVESYVSVRVENTLDLGQVISWGQGIHRLELGHTLGLELGHTLGLEQDICWVLNRVYIWVRVLHTLGLGQVICWGQGRTQIRVREGHMLGLGQNICLGQGIAYIRVGFGYMLGQGKNICYNQNRSQVSVSYMVINPKIGFQWLINSTYFPQMKSH